MVVFFVWSLVWFTEFFFWLGVVWLGCLVVVRVFLFVVWCWWLGGCLILFLVFWFVGVGLWGVGCGFDGVVLGLCFLVGFLVRGCFF